MKKNNLAFQKRRLCKNPVIIMSDGESTLLEFFCYMQMLHKTEHALLCNKLLENDAFREYLGLDEDDGVDFFSDEDEAEDFFEKKPVNSDFHVRMENESLVKLDEETVDVPIPLYNRKIFENFKNVCNQMQAEGYLNGVDLPKAVMIMESFTPSLVLKAYEAGYWTYDVDTAHIISADISSYGKKDFSSLSKTNKTMMLSSLIYATIWDLRSEGREEEAEKMHSDFIQTLKGLPEYFSANTFESLNATLSVGPKTVEKPFIQNLSSFMAKQQKKFFQGEYLSLEQTVELNDSIHQIKILKAENILEWKQKARPIFAKMLRDMPYYLKQDFLESYVHDLSEVEKTFYDSRLEKDSWQMHLINSISKCYNYDIQDCLSQSEVSVKMQELKMLANKSIYLNPIWTKKQKSDFFDVCCDLKIEDVQKKSTHRSNQKNDEGRCRE